VSDSAGTALGSPSRGEGTPKRSGGGGRIRNIGTFYKQVVAELRKVIWPTRKEVMNLTAVVVALAAALGAFLGGIDFVFQEFFRLLLRAAGAGGY